MAKWLVIGGVATLAYLLVTSKGLHAVRPGDPAKPLPQAPKPQSPAPPAQPQTNVVEGAGASILKDAADVAGIIGSLADAAKKFGLFGSSDAANQTVVAEADPVGIQRDPAFGAAFF